MTTNILFSTHFIIRLLLPLFFSPLSIWQQAACVQWTWTKKEEERQRKRRMERQEEERMRAYIKAVFTDICALGVESPYEYQYEPMERKQFFFFFFPAHRAIHAHKKSIQVSVMASLWAWVLLCEQGCFGSAVSLSLSWVWLAFGKNTLCQVQLWWTLQYANQIGLNACMSCACQSAPISNS